MSSHLEFTDLQGEPRGRKNREAWVDFGYLSFLSKANDLLGYFTTFDSQVCSNRVSQLRLHRPWMAFYSWCSFSSNSSSTIHPISQQCIWPWNLSVLLTVRVSYCIESPVLLGDFINGNRITCMQHRGWEEWSGLTRLPVSHVYSLTILRNTKLSKLTWYQRSLVFLWKFGLAPRQSCLILRYTVRPFIDLNTKSSSIYSRY